jgi:hypothetical protein
MKIMKSIKQSKPNETNRTKDEFLSNKNYFFYRVFCIFTSIIITLMDNKERISICKKCKINDFDTKQGIICGKTNKKPDFQEICQYFEAKSGEKNPFSHVGMKINYDYENSTRYTTDYSFEDNYYFEKQQAASNSDKPKLKKPQRDILLMLSIATLSIVFIRIISFLFESQLIGSLIGIFICSLTLPATLIYYLSHIKRKRSEKNASEILSLLLIIVFGTIIYGLYAIIFLWWTYTAWVEVLIYAVSLSLIGIPVIMISKKIIPEHIVSK